MIKHVGNDCPVPRNTIVRIDLGDGVIDDDEYVGRAGRFNWGLGPGDAGEGRIVAYEVLTAAPPTDSKPTNPKDAIALDKLPMHLVSGIVKAYQAIAHYLGNVKYGSHNYRSAGIRNSVYKSAMDRHMDAWWEGEENDPTDGTPHLANAQACLNILIEGKYTATTIDDRPPVRARALRQIRADFEALMPQIRTRYADKRPHHFTRDDDSQEFLPPGMPPITGFGDTGLGGL